MVAPRWIFIALLVSLSLGLCSSYRPLAVDHTVQREAEVEDKNGNFSNNDVEGGAIGTEYCVSCGQIAPAPYPYGQQPPLVIPPLPPLVIPTLPPIIVPPCDNCPVTEPCYECIDTEEKEQNETAVVPSMEFGLVELGSLAQVP